MPTVNIPNFITISRVIAIPFFIVALSYNYNGIALAIFVACGITDGLDGFIARAYQQRTEIGAFLDPLADKLLIGASYITLAILGLVAGWLTVALRRKSLSRRQYVRFPVSRKSLGILISHVTSLRLFLSLVKYG